MSFKSRLVSAILILSFIITGCASFPGGELPKYAYTDIKPPEKRPSVGYDIKFYDIFGNESDRPAKLFSERIENVLKTSNSFEKYGQGLASEPFHISFIVRNEGNAFLSFVSGFVSGSSLFIIPGFARDHIVMTVRVKKGEQVIKEYNYKDHMDTWFQALLIVLTPFRSPNTVSTEVFDNMMLNLLHDMHKDRVFDI